MGEWRTTDRTAPSVAEGALVGERALAELLALGGRALPLLRRWTASDPACGVARLTLATCDSLGDAALKEQLVVAHRDAQTAGEREASLVYGVFLFSHRQYRLTADHLAAHFVRWPADEVAGLMLGAFHACGDPVYRAYGDALVEEQTASAGPDNWAWVSWLAAIRAEQGRIQEAYELAGQALALNPRSGVAVHALAHTEHERGTGHDAVVLLDSWLTSDPQAAQSRHLNRHADGWPPLVFHHRDIRDRIVGQIRALTQPADPVGSLPEHLVYRDILTALPTLDARITLALTDPGFPGTEEARRSRWLLHHPAVCVITHEELAGPGRGGTIHARAQALTRLLTAISHPDPSAVPTAPPPAAPGAEDLAIGTGRALFTPAHERLLDRHHSH
ncbi:hypothetical protein [Streptomyces sp. NBC_01014]|uniref:hypothetical protein n=1 Tax=Streptomyces sp. NBC_01014 TaxID=2903719 RepID=UPI0038678290|nr:hypothetical protein OG282_33120 [Streptomyces sp. NBC_01014]